MPKKLTQEEFIACATEIHKGKYCYDKVVFKNMRTKVIITCPIHGDFEQLPSAHLSGQGCGKCAGKGLTTEELIKEFRRVHGDKYGYGRVGERDGNGKVWIWCPKHGYFKQHPSKHLAGQGCRKCYNEHVNDGRRVTFDEFVRRANEVHNGRYQYRETELNNLHDTVEIYCPCHGWFTQIAWDHLNGHGCQHCNQSRTEKEVERLLAEMNVRFETHKKFDWLGLQHLDFYLTDYDIAIECQGGQHFFPVEHFGGEEEFRKTVERDKRKATLCEINGVKLHYIRYDENVEEAVKRIMCNVESFAETFAGLENFS